MGEGEGGARCQGFAGTMGSPLPGIATSIKFTLGCLATHFGQPTAWAASAASAPTCLPRPG